MQKVIYGVCIVLFIGAAYLGQILYFNTKQVNNENIGIDNIMLCKPYFGSYTQDNNNILLGGRSVIRQRNPDIAGGALIYVYSGSENPVTLSQKDGTISYIEYVLTQIKIQNRDIASAFLVDPQTGPQNKTAFFDINTLIPVDLSIAGTNDVVTGFESTSTGILLGNREARLAIVNNKDWVYIDTTTLNIIKTAGTNQDIGDVYCALRVNGKDFLQVNIPGTKKSFFIDQKSLEAVTVYVSGTHDVITTVTDTGALIAGEESTLVEINRKNWVYLNPKTLEKMSDAKQPTTSPWTTGNSFSDF